MKTHYLKTFANTLMILLFIAFFQGVKANNNATAKKSAELTRFNFSTADTTRHSIKKANKIKGLDEEEEKEKGKKGTPVDGVDDDIKARNKQEFEKTKDPALNRVPVERLLQARKIKDQMLTRPVGNIKTGTPTGASLSTIQWAERGPNNVGGRTRALMYDMNDAANGYKKVFAGGVGGGLWVTSDITATTITWTKINDFFENIAISCIAQDPTNPQNIYVGTGEGWDNGDAIQGLGVWKSADGGATWTQLTSTTSFLYVNSILVDKNSNVYVAGNGYGVEKSSNGGTSWTQVIANPADGADLQLAANGDIYASTGVFSTGNIFVSSFSVNGANTGNAGTWTNITPETTGVITPTTQSWWRIKLAVAPNNANLVYALMEGVNNNNLTSVQQYNRATNTWTVKTVPAEAFGNGQAWYSIAAAVDPNNSNVLYAGSLDAEESVDGGQTWTQYTSWDANPSASNYVHADHHAYVYSPGSSSKLVMGTDGGVFYTANANVVPPAFIIRDHTYDVTQFYAVALHPTNNNYFLAGAQDNGSQQFTTGGLGATTEVTGGDGADAFIDPNNGNIQITSYVYNNHWISVDGGNNFTQLFFGNTGSFINPSDYDPATKNLYSGYAGGQYFLWSNVVNTSSPATSVVTVSGFNGQNISAVTVSPLTANRVYFGLGNGTVVRVDNANTGTSNTGVVLSPGVNGGYVSCIAIDPTTEDHLLVTYSNYGVTTVWETKNATAASPVWTAVVGNLPDMPVRSAIFFPGDATKALIATELGVWTTDLLNGASTTWNPSNSGLANVEVDMLKFRASDRTLAAATHGRGLFTTTLPAPAAATLLTHLTISSGTLTPTFATATTSYSANVTNAVASITVTPTAIAGATITVNGTAVPSGTASGAIALSLGSNNIDIVAKSQDGTTTNSYTIAVTRLPLAPAISYSSPQSYNAGVAISPLAPGSTGGVVAAPGYNSSSATLGSGFTTPASVAVDAAGNIYVADFGHNLVKKMPAGGGTPVAIGSGFSQPSGVAVDAAGNVYVADFGNNAVKKIPGGTGTPVAIGSGFSGPSGVAVDAAGNVYVGDKNNNAVKEIPVGGGATITLASGISSPEGVAVDAAGDVFVAETADNAVLEITAGSTTPVPVGSGFLSPSGVAVDPLGNIFVADAGNNEIQEILTVGGQTPLGAGLSGPTGVTIDGAGNVYIADKGNNAVKEITPAGGYYISTALPAGLSFDNTAGVISGTATVGSPSTIYTITAYNAGGKGSATLNITVSFPSPPTLSYTSPHSYPISVAIAPLSPTSSGVAAPVYSANTSIIKSGFSNPGGIDFDAAGDLFVADAGNNEIKKFPVGGGAAVIIGSGFSSPNDVKVDASGNVYVADAGNGAVKEVPGGTGTPVILASGFAFPAAIAVDVAGNVYVADGGGTTVYKIPAAGGTPIVLGSSFNGPFGVAVDVAGNVYVSDANNGVYEIPVNGSGQITLLTGLNNPNGVLVDHEGNIFVTDSNNGFVREIPAGGGSPVTLTFKFGFPFMLAVDASGDLLVADDGDGTIKQVKPIGGYYISANLPKGLNFSGTTGVISGTPTVVTPATNYTVTGYNIAGSKAAIVNIATTTASTNAGLSSLTLSAGTILPAFATATTVYTVSELYAAGSITVTPTTADPSATVTVNGAAVNSGTASAPIPLIVGSNKITTVVTAHDGVTTKTYTVTATRGAASTNALLASISLSPVSTLVGSSGPGYLNFTSAVPYSTSSVQVIPTAKDATATITVNGVTVTSGSLSQSIPLAVGANTITTVLTAQDGTTTKTVIITVNRALSNDANLSALKISTGTLSPVFSPTGITYTASVAHTVTSITVTPTTDDAAATVKVNGTAVTSGTSSAAIPLVVGANAIKVVITAPNGTTTQTYTITVTRGPSTDALLTSIKLTPTSALTVVTGPSYVNYTTSVPNTTSSVTVTATEQDATATIKINGVTTASGVASASIPLAVGSNVINIVSTAQDGVTTKTYTITATRAASTDALLTAIKLTPAATLKIVTGPGYVNYTTTVPNTTSSVTVTATTQDATATITVNGISIKSGVASAAIPLVVGSNTITTVVTAADGKTTKSYIITATRSASSDALLTSIKLTPASTLTIVTGPGYVNYTTSVPNTTSSVTVTATKQDAGASITVNGVTTASGTASAAIPLAVGSNTITTVVTAADGTTTKSYIITATRAAAGGTNNLDAISVTKPADSPTLANDGIVVHQGVSPNGDGINDFLKIDGIASYPDNRLLIVDRNGATVYQVKGYDNQTAAFDGHSNINGKMQLPGTYFYSLDYTVNGQSKHTTGYIILKY